MIPVDDVAPTKVENKPEIPELLTIKECAALIPGLSEHTVRQLVKRGQIAYMRSGAGERGKILVYKSSLLKYLGDAN
ncbi:MAG: helix-turn-helix domain-containing protein [Ruminococcus sp.]|nr:helix-turn-helix domain-containing protein [Ruminococcus sp.]